MRNRLLPPLSLSLILVGAPVLRAEASNMANMVSLYNFLNQIMLGKQEAGTPRAQASLIMAIPGFPIPEKGLDMTNKTDRETLDGLLDTMPAPEAHYVSSHQKYSDIYFDIINNSKTQAVTRTKAEQERYDALQAELKHPVLDGEGKTIQEGSEVMTMYLMKEGAFLDAVDARNAELAKNKGESSRRTDSRVINALSDWKTSGFMARVKAANVEFNALTNRGAAQWWSKLLDDVTLRSTDDKTPKQLTFPRPENWGEDNGWTTFSWSAAESASSSNSHSKEVQAQAEYSSAGLNVTASGGWSKQTAEAMMANSTASLKMDLKRVLIMRPWMDYRVFTSKAWEYSGDLLTKDHPLFSDGQPMASNKGLMPIIIDQVWLARNVVLSGTWEKKTASAMKQAIEAHVSVSYGPFSFSGGYKQQDQENASSSQTQSSSLSTDGIQVIAYVVTPVPKCPEFKLSTDPTATTPAVIKKK